LAGRPARCSLARIVSDARSKTGNTIHSGSTRPRSKYRPHIAHTPLRKCQGLVGVLALGLVLALALGLAADWSKSSAAGWAGELAGWPVWEQAMATIQCRRRRRKLPSRRRKTERSRRCFCTPTATAMSPSQLACQPASSLSGGSVCRSDSAQRKRRKGRQNSREHQSNL